MSRFIVSFFTIFILALFPFQVMAHAQNGEKGSIISNWLTVHNGPSYETPAIDWLKKGTEVTIEQKIGDYSKIGYNGKQGYVATRYLKPAAQTIFGNAVKRFYTVQSGDTLSFIAQKEHMTVEQLKSLNQLHSNLIIVGQKLWVKNQKADLSSSIPYTVEPGDSLWRIANHFHQSIQTLKNINSLKTDLLDVGDKLKIPIAANKMTVSADGPLKGRIIVLSPGHGGRDMGAEGNGVIEKKVTLQIALKTEADLKKQGAKVIMARTGDYYVTLNDRAAMAAKYNADIFVAIHVNKLPNPAIHGTTAYFNQTLYEGRKNPYPKHSYKLAEDIVNAVSSKAGTTNRGAQNADFRVLRSNSVPSTLVETGFLSNKKNAAELLSNTWQGKVAKGITKGIDQYFGS